MLGARRLGASVLAALAVPESRMDELADIVSGYDEVNHNYAREHSYNLWFVVVAPDDARLRAVLHMEFTPRGEAVWISARDDDAVVVYDTATHRETARIAVPSPSGIFFTSRAGRIGL